MAFLWKVSDRKANDYYQARQREKALVDDLKHNATAIGSFENPDQEEPVEEMEWDEKRAQAITRARDLLPKLGQKNIQDVMSLVIDAVEAGREDLPSREIAEALGLQPATVRTLKMRGFERLARVAREEGLVGQEFDFANLESEEEITDDDGRC